MSKIECFQMALNMCEMWFNGIKNSFFSKNYKKSPNSCPAAGGPDPPSMIRLSYTGFLKTSPKLRICTFQRPLPLQNPGKVPTGKFLMTSLHVVCGLGLPNQKFWLRLWNGDCLKTFFEDLVFFLENTCGCVLGPWPRECLFSERLSLALDFFLCSWPRALCSRLHLCHLPRFLVPFAAKLYDVYRRKHFVYFLELLDLWCHKAKDLKTR